MINLVLKFKEIIFFFFLCFSLLGNDFEGRVVSVHDGDTVRVLVGKEQIKVRLFGIDAPESHQSFGKVSEKELKGLIWKKDVKVEFKEKDQYGRTVGVIHLGDQNINLEMVKRGMAWVYRSFNKDPNYIEAEEIAKKSKLGLWKDNDPTPPWKFRKSEKEERFKK